MIKPITNFISNRMFIKTLPVVILAFAAGAGLGVHFELIAAINTQTAAFPALFTAMLNAIFIILTATITFTLRNTDKIINAYLLLLIAWFLPAFLYITGVWGFVINVLFPSEAIAMATVLSVAPLFAAAYFSRKTKGDAHEN